MFKWKVLFTLKWHKQTIKIHIFKHTKLSRRKINTLHAITHNTHSWSSKIYFGFLSLTRIEWNSIKIYITREKINFSFWAFLASIDKWTVIYFVYKKSRYAGKKYLKPRLKIVSLSQKFVFIFFGIEMSAENRSIMITANCINYLKWIKLKSIRISLNN